MNALEQRRLDLIDAVIDLPGAIAAWSILRRLDDHLPTAFRDRLHALGLFEAVRDHFIRVRDEPDYDQVYAVERLVANVLAGVPVQALLGPGGSGKTHVFAHQLLPRLKADLAAAMQITSPTNLGVNVLARHGVAAQTNHQALYSLGFGPSVTAVRDWIIADGIGQLPDDVLPRLVAAWRNTTAGPHERAKAKAKADLLEGALRELGLAGGLMEVLPPRWNLRTEPDAEAPVALWLMDEAGMATSAVLDDIRRFALLCILIGDPFQLPAIIEPEEAARGVTGALARVPLSHQVHLFHDRRTKGETQHLRAAKAIPKTALRSPISRGGRRTVRSRDSATPDESTSVG
jgi:hypothetical protein